MEKRAVVIAFFQQGKDHNEIYNLLDKKNYSRQFIKYTINRYLETGTINDRKRTGRPRTVRTKKVIEKLKSAVKRNSNRSQRKLATQYKTTKTTIRNILTKDLGLKAFKKTKCHRLTTEQKKKRFTRSKKLLKSTHVIDPENILFSDEKIFQLEAPYVPQNQRVYAKNKEDLNSDDLVAPSTTWPQQVMVWGGISGKGKTELVFVEKGVKINSENYMNNILIPYLNPLNQSIFKNIQWIFQQDSAPSHSSKSTQAWCRENLPGFISSEEWPPFSPDLNPCDFWLWGGVTKKSLHEET